MNKHLAFAAVLAMPCAALAGQAMAFDESFALARNLPAGVPEIASMHYAASETLRDPGAGRGADETNERTPGKTGARGAHNHVLGKGDATAANAHKAHGKTPWQSLLPGVVK